VSVAESLSAWLRKVRYHPLTLRIAKTMGVKRQARKIYSWMSCRINRKIRISLCGYSAEFHVTSPRELAFLEDELLDVRVGEVVALEKLLANLGTDDVAYDIGASLGTHALFMARKVGPEGCVVAFEPQTKNYAKLIANANLNDLKNIRSFRLAVGRRSGKMGLYGCSEDDFGLFSMTRAEGSRWNEDVEMVHGDAFVHDHRLPLPHVVKIDVEGYEYDVLRGLQNTLSRERCRLVFCEIHPTMLPREVTSEEVFSLLRSCGYVRAETFPRRHEIHAFFTRR